MELNGKYYNLWSKYPSKDWWFGLEGSISLKFQELAEDTGFTNKGKKILAVKKNQWTSTSGQSGEKELIL